MARLRTLVRLSLSCLVLIAAGGLVRADDADDDPTFADELSRLLDRWNDSAPEDRLGKAIDLCTKRSKTKSDDVVAHLELARLKLARQDGETAATEARMAEASADARPATDKEGKALAAERKTQAKALHLLAYQLAGQDRLAKEADADKQKKLTDEFAKNVKELLAKLIEAAGSKENAQKLVSEERERIASAVFLNDLGRPPKELEGKKDTENNEIRLDAYTGKVLIVVFWGAWDPGAKAQLAEIRTLHEQYRERGLDVVGVSLDRDRAAMDAVLKETKIGWRHYFDGKGEANDVAAAWKVRGFADYLLDHQGKVRYVGVHGEGLAAAAKQLVERAEKAAKQEKKKGD